MLLSSSNRKYQPYPLSCFSVVVYLRCLLHHILSLFAYAFRENRDFVFIIIVQFMMDANSQIRFGSQIVFVKMPVRHILSSVWVILSIFSQLSTIQYMELCVFSLLFSLVMIERIYTLSYHYYKIDVCIHCLGLSYETMVCAVCLSIFFWHNGELLFHCFLLRFTYILMPHSVIILYYRLPYFHVSNNALFLHSTLVLSFYIDIVLTLSTGDYCIQ